MKLGVFFFPLDARMIGGNFRNKDSLGINLKHQLIKTRHQTKHSQSLANLTKLNAKAVLQGWASSQTLSAAGSWQRARECCQREVQQIIDQCKEEGHLVELSGLEWA